MQWECELRVEPVQAELEFNGIRDSVISATIPGGSSWIFLEKARVNISGKSTIGDHCQSCLTETTGRENSQILTCSQPRRGRIYLMARWDL